MPDLIDDGTWREAALARMSEAFPTNRGLWPMYRLMAGAHRYAIDYIEQAPVIVLAAAHGNAHVSWSERAFIQEQFRKMCESKAQLRDVMRSYGLPLPLRLLDARVLTASRATVIRRLALMNPSTLAQIIPATRQKQDAWLQALQNWCEGMAMASHPAANDYRCLFCVASYWPNVVEGKSRIYSIRENGSRVATLEVTGQLTQYRGRNDALTVVVQGNGQRSRYQVGQLVGARNSRPAPEVVKVVGTFVEEINNHARVATTVGAVDDALDG